MIIVREELNRVSETSVKIGAGIQDKINNILDIMYRNTVSTASNGEIPIDRAVAIITAEMINGIDNWTHSVRGEKGQYSLARHTSKQYQYQFDRTVDNALYGIGQILKKAMYEIAKFIK